MRLFTYIYAGDQRIAMYDADDRLHYYLNDHLGSTRVVIDSTGAVQDKYKRYYAFGAPEAQTVSTDQAYRYTGKPFDEDGAIDLYYYGARYYDPYLMRFTSIDPMRWKYPTLSPYAYVSNNPLKYIDPNGAEPVQNGLAGPAVAADRVRKRNSTMTDFLDNNTNPYVSTGTVLGRYVGLKDGSVVDMLHFTRAAAETIKHSQGVMMVGTMGIPNIAARMVAGIAVQLGGLKLEFKQAFSSKAHERHSGFSHEDMSSNALGAVFALYYDSDLDLADQIQNFLEFIGGISKDEYKKRWPYRFDNMPRTETDARDEYTGEDDEPETPAPHTETGN